MNKEIITEVQLIKDTSRVYYIVFVILKVAYIFELNTKIPTMLYINVKKENKPLLK